MSLWRKLQGKALAHRGYLTGYEDDDDDDVSQIDTQGIFYMPHNPMTRVDTIFTSRKSMESIRGRTRNLRLTRSMANVGVSGNEAADELSGRGCDLPNPSSTVLTHTEIPSFQRNKMNLTWRNPPAHHWYAAKSPGHLYRAGVAGLIRRPWRALEAVTCVV
ncbi:hypothetical protein TNCV_3660781 [Trichonephila clavipes]|nr:hypothetical protein TNCV_3660781 [Trichonephila clavipes]